MTIFREKHLQKLSKEEQGPFFSVYLPTFRTHPDNHQDAKVYRKLLETFESVKEQYKKDSAVVDIFKKFEALADDYHFWKHTLDGLAIFATPQIFEVYRLKRPVKPLAVMADSFHTKPLWKYLQSSDRYHVLSLSLNSVRLYEGNRDQLDEVAIPEHLQIPDTMLQALDHEQRDLHATLASYRTATGEQWEGNQNHGLRKTDVRNDTAQFFRAVDRAIDDEFSKPSGLPLLIAGLPEHHHLFRKVSKNNLLMESGIMINAMALDANALRKLAWEKFEPYYNARLQSEVERFLDFAGSGLGADQVDQIVKDAYDGRIDTLLLAEDRIIPGRIVDREQVAYYDEDHPLVKSDDVLDDLGELVRSHGGKVIVVPDKKLPIDSGVAAINRF